MANKNTYEMAIPFSGFYYSIHNDMFDRELESLIDYHYQETGKDLPDSIANLQYDIDYSEPHEKYAKDYADSFLDYYDLKGDFAAMDSPREYNFATDRVFVTIDSKTLRKLLRETDCNDFDNHVKERFTSRSGFISFYDNNWREWGNVKTWDHNQIGALLEAWLITTQGDDVDEMQIIDNYYLYEVYDYLSGDPAFNRFTKLISYCIERASRPPMTCRELIRSKMLPFSGTPLGKV